MKTGSWTILAVDDLQSHDGIQNHKHTLVQCVCGTKKHVRTAALRAGRSQSCGCRGRKSESGSKACECECGNPYTRTVAELDNRGNRQCDRCRDLQGSYLTTMKGIH